MNRQKVRFLLQRILHPARRRILQRTSPLSTDWGYDRGTPIDRYYIEDFLNDNKADIRGRVLEIKDSTYSRRFGSGVTRFEVLDIDASNPEATMLADLSKADDIPSDAFDCFILTQTLQLIFDVRSTIQNAYRLLRPNGVLLVTVPSLSRIVTDAPEDFWRFTPDSCARLFGDVFGAENVALKSYGNVLACCAFLQGMAHEELPGPNLSKHDDLFPLIVSVRAVKRASDRIYGPHTYE
jgi:SAM-dependent methyltransferase